MFNVILMKLGILDKGLNILGGAKYSLVLMTSANLWKSLGYNAVIFLAAIAGIDQTQYEAAEIDGANRFQRIRFITVPGLMGTLTMLLIMSSGWMLRANFEQFKLFTNATNRQTMEVFDTYVYRYGLELGRYSYATAVSIFNSVVSIILLTIVNTTSKRLNDRALF